MFEITFSPLSSSTMGSSESNFCSTLYKSGPYLSSRYVYVYCIYVCHALIVHTKNFYLEEKKAKSFIWLVKGEIREEEKLERFWLL